MRHDISITGFAYRLRPATVDDSAFILKLRNNPELARYINATSSCLADQELWFKAYEERSGDYYFIIENQDGQPEGTIGLYDLDKDHTKAEWGRWILLPGSKAATESAWLIYRIAFEQLGLDYVYCRTVADNEKVVSFHDSFGVKRQAVLPGLFELNGRSHDAIEHGVVRNDWGTISLRLKKLCERLAKLLQRSEATS
ncbi:GNAT family N-acetyltransferase [Govanella unica]|uniref:GNAT family N-acetyltransferase n=1 Tax=Govanella unica TaxID=2975056 RepID=A0A9X3TVJ2_9PROT|nr:GNAT family N-acetyltransferase [Govania unica]MDA5192509.1 GNAT family N-acetyltransferase [Govania unica]